MAEQDREDLVPSVLNDLMDVDGEPADGDMLIRQGGAWVPSAGPFMPSWIFQRTAGKVMADGVYENTWTGWVDYSANNDIVNDDSLSVDGAGTIQQNTPGVYAFNLAAQITGLVSGDFVLVTFTGDGFPQYGESYVSVNAELQTFLAGNGDYYLQSAPLTGRSYPDGTNGSYPMPLYPQVRVDKVAAAHTVTVTLMYLYVTRLGL